MRKSTNFTPIDQVNDQSPFVKIGVPSLELPAGLEPSWIGVNVPVLERSVRLAGAHYGFVLGGNDEKDDIHVSGSIGEDGSLSNTAAGVAKKQRGDFVSLKLDGDVNDFATIITLNNEARRADSGDVANQYDPYVQADLLDKALRKQLMRVSRASNSNRDRRPLGVYLDFTTLCNIGVFSATDTLQAPVGKLMFGTYATLLGLYGAAREMKSRAIGLEAQHSLFFNTKLDRIALSTAYIATHRIIGVPKVKA